MWMNKKSKLVALEVAIELAQVLKPALDALKAKNHELWDQAKRAIQSVVLNLAEGGHSKGGNKGKHYAIAAGSHEELRAALRTALAFGELTERDLAAAESIDDRLGGLVWGLTHPRE